MKVIYIQHGPGIGGSKISLYHMLKCAPADQESYVALAAPPQKDYEELIKDYTSGIFYLDIPTWQKYTRTNAIERIRQPFGDTLRLLKLIPACLKLEKIIQSQQINLVHTNSSITPAGAFAAYYAKVPHVWHVRESFGSQCYYHPILGNKITYWLMNKLSKVIICNSEYTANPFRENYIKTVVINNGLDLDYYDGEVTSGKILRSNYGIHETDLVIGMVGNLNSELKKHNLFLDLAAIMSRDYKPLKFIVFGGSANFDQSEYTRKLAKKVKRLRMGEKVIWAEFIKDSAAITNSMDIMVHPALTEGSGRVVMEAMSAGKPVVAMRSGGVQELIQDGETGFLVEPGDIREMVERVKLILDNENLRKKIGDNAREYARIHFSDQASMDAIVEIYQDIMEKWVG